MKQKLLQTWARKSAKLLAAFALLATTSFGVASAETATLEIEKADVQTGNTSASYVETEFEFIAKNNKFKTNNINPDKFQVRGNKALDKDFYLFNTTEFGVIKEIKLTASGSNLVPSKINLFISDKAYTAAPTGDATVTGGANNTSKTTSATLTVPTDISGKFFYLQFTNGATSGNCILSKIEITYEAAPVSADLGEIMYNGETANGKSITGNKGTEFKFTAANATSMSITIGDATTPSVTSESNEISWELPNASTYALHISATDGTATKTADFTVQGQAAPQCGSPVFSEAGPNITKGSTVTITCENAVKIMYWMDNEALSEVAPAGVEAVDVIDGKVVTNPIDENCYLHAYGINADGKAGIIGGIQYTITEPTSATFDFLNNSYGLTPQTDGNTYEPDMTNPVSEIFSGIVSIKFEGEKYRYWDSDKTLRVQTGSSFTISVPDGFYITGIKMTGTSASNVDHGTFDLGNWTPTEGENVSAVKFSPTTTTKIKTITINYAKLVPELDGEPVITIKHDNHDGVLTLDYNFTVKNYNDEPISVTASVEGVEVTFTEKQPTDNGARAVVASHNHHGTLEATHEDLKGNMTPSVTTVITVGGKQLYTITKSPDVTTGISSIEAENGEAVYFNLQGVRVDNPTKGLYIRVANGKSQKVMK